MSLNRYANLLRLQDAAMVGVMADRASSDQLLGLLYDRDDPLPREERLYILCVVGEHSRRGDELAALFIDLARDGWPMTGKPFEGASWDDASYWIDHWHERHR